MCRAWEQETLRDVMLTMLWYPLAAVRDPQSLIGAAWADPAIASAAASAVAVMMRFMLLPFLGVWWLRSRRRSARARRDGALYHSIKEGINMTSPPGDRRPVALCHVHRWDVRRPLRHVLSRQPAGTARP